MADQISIEGLGGALGTILIETFAALSPSPKVADERLEALASCLMDVEAQLLPGNEAKSLLSAVVRHLVGTEGPGGQVSP